ncbi:right-handed parallel beta-helix repeat-containing protein, partial [Victivallis vadensis]|uniref:right-handed parallel beta-helix repeat-containing protein n=1 Tax=Victivallis vadensis TaxID=172901 RepID=UPI003AF655B0
KESFLAVIGYRPAEYTELILPGDEVRLLAKENFAVLGTAKVRKVEIAEDVPGLDLKQVYMAAEIPDYITYRITVDGPLPEPGTLVDFPAINSPGFVIRSNYFHDHRARGLRIMAYSGLIENNRIERLESSAISIGPEYAYWQEGGWVNGVTVRNNRIESVDLGGSAYSRFGYSLGAICTFVRNEGGKAPFYPGNRNVVIENNRIGNCSLAGIYLLASDGATVRGNVISGVNWGNNPDIGGNYGIRYEKQPIGQFGSKDSTIENNEVKP